MAPDWLDPLLARLPGARVSVFGDFALDAYWGLSSTASELSVETGLPVHQVERQHYSPGGAGNVATGLVSLGVSQVIAVGLIGSDPFGSELRSLLDDAGIGTSLLTAQKTGWQTQVFAKPIQDGSEQERIDFGSLDHLGPATASSLVSALEGSLDRCGACVLNQQVSAGITTPPVIEAINGLIDRHREVSFVVDARDRPGLFTGACLKLNEGELLRLVGQSHSSEAPSLERICELAVACSDKAAQPVFVTRGAEGALVAHGGAARVIPGHPVPDPIDPVGAGDAFVAAVAAALSVDASPHEAAAFANAAAAATVSQLHTTGSPTPARVRELLRGVQA